MEDWIYKLANDLNDLNIIYDLPKIYLSSFVDNTTVLKIEKAKKEIVPEKTLHLKRTSIIEREKLKYLGICKICGSTKDIFKNGRSNICRRCLKNTDKKYTRKSTPKQKVSDAISRGIRNSIANNKKGMHWEKIVHFSLEELMKHLESKFKEGMSWDNYGSEWHIDHIRPIANFSFSSFKEKEFLECWSLKNLQPLWAEENLKKGCKIY